MDKNKIAAYQKLRQQVARADSFLQGKEKVLNHKKNQLRHLKPGAFLGDDGSGVTQTGPENSGTYIKSAMNKLPSSLIPGNVGDINRVIWPYYFTTDYAVVAPNSNFRTGFTITQEAAFIWMSFTKVVYIQDEDGTLSYIDPDVSGAAGCAFNLSMTIRDSSSERDFENSPFDIDMVGNPRWPTKYPRPSIFLPNGNIEISFTNSDPDITYVPFVTAFGYRIRIEDARTMLSLMTS